MDYHEWLAMGCPPFAYPVTVHLVVIPLDPDDRQALGLDMRCDTEEALKQLVDEETRFAEEHNHRLRAYVEEGAAASLPRYDPDQGGTGP